MKIVQYVTLVSADGAFGGPLAVAIEQCRELARLGHDVTLLAAWDGELKLRVPGVRVVLQRSRQLPGAGFSGLLAPGLPRWLRRHQHEIDVVHVHLGRHLLDIKIASVARQLRLPYTLQTHGMVMPSGRLAVKAIDLLSVRGLLRDAAKVFTLSDGEAEGIRALAPTASLLPIRNGVRLIERPSRDSDPTLEVLFLARLHPRKRVMTFAEAAAKVDQGTSGMRFSVVGPDEGDLERLEQYIERNPHLNLSYEGAATPGSGAGRIAQADVFVLPSVGEVFPMALLEALAAGTPVVMTSDCALAPLLERSGAGLVTDGTSGSIAAAIQRLAGDPDLRDQLRRAGQQLVAGELGAGAVARELEDAYAAAVEPRPRIVWVTNQAAPYRLPLWAEIARHVHLEIWLLESDRKLRKDSNNRGEDWALGARSFPFVVRTIPTLVVKRGEARHYVSGWLPYDRRHRADAVLVGGWDSPAFWVAALGARLLGIRPVGFYESHAGSQHHRRGLIANARRSFFRMLSGVVVPGVAARDTLIAEGVPEDAVHVGFNAVDVSQIHREANLRRAAAPPSAGQPLRILFVGQLIARKNVGVLIDALKDERLSEATLSIVGTGPLAAALEEQVAKSKLDERVRFLGPVSSDAIAEVFASHDVLVHPALEEVWGLVVNEALAAGLHVIVSERAGVAASVAAMSGVTVVNPTTADIANALHEHEGVEPINNPEILGFGTEEFAQVFLRALLPEARS